MISSALKPLTGRIIAVLILLVYSLASPADQNDPALDRLFERLTITTSEEEASNITREIWQRWTANDDPEVSQLMQTGIRALNYSTYRRALQSFDRVIEMAPEFAEGWNKRATLYYHIKEYRRSIDDIKETLRLEPRHFGAWSGLGLVSIAQENYSGALAAFKKALSINPHIANIRRYVQKLEDWQRREDEENAI
ncbi:MAG: tetratricopeptide repeat protein [Gammaproteobacteria bacterium]|jgi:tetratricopeptide (TPR) repeat protein|nr:tetratricopeptide repeat protein [Gammaproteobacteria bacterium]|tara:strand:- start:243 stop:827 length:585 start_codon:yes stop_codon:yes gene_type:complete